MAEGNTGREPDKRQDTRLQGGVEPTGQGRLFIPPTDIRETAEGIVLTADMPGVRADGVEVTLENSVLTIRGSCADEHRPSGEADYAEYEVGDYQRSFSLSDDVDRDRIEARMNNGVLTLTIPKTRPSRRRIDVKAG